MLGLQEATIPASQSLGLQFADDHKGKHFVSHVSETSPLVGRISEGGHIEKVRTPDTGTSHSADFSAQEIYIVLTSLTGEPRTLTYANVGRRPSPSASTRLMVKRWVPWLYLRGGLIERTPSIFCAGEAPGRIMTYRAA